MEVLRFVLMCTIGLQRKVYFADTSGNEPKGPTVCVDRWTIIVSGHKLHTGNKRFQLALSEVVLAPV